MMDDESASGRWINIFSREKWWSDEQYQKCEWGGMEGSSRDEMSTALARVKCTREE
jgi:hypothetical protein